MAAHEGAPRIAGTRKQSRRRLKSGGKNALIAVLGSFVASAAAVAAWAALYATGWAVIRLGGRPESWAPDSFVRQGAEAPLAAVGIGVFLNLAMSAVLIAVLILFAICLAILVGTCLFRIGNWSLAIGRQFTARWIFKSR